ncbi:cupin domain-containing protein [Patescibacteria group bacterium]|nr:cupin domain-containing protein [Patescibacteria group bacterium]
MAGDESKSEGVPEWIGNTPFPSDQKKTTIITENMVVPFLYGFEGNQVENQVFVSTDRILMAEWILSPGAHYEPPGLHLYGDECYYIVEGNAIAFNPETGETYKLFAGDALLIPQKTRHQIFNFDTKIVKAIACVAPRIWAEDKMGTFIPEVERPKFYTSDFFSQEKSEIPERTAILAKTCPSIDSLGKWPAPGPQLRHNKQLVQITPKEHLPLIHGKKQHVLMDFIVSNDYMHLALLTIPVGGYSELEAHKGDEAGAVLEGNLAVRIPSKKENRKNATYDHYHIEQGRKFFIPEGVRHQYINFTDNPIKTYIATAPEL